MADVKEEDAPVLDVFKKKPSQAAYIRKIQALVEKDPTTHDHTILVTELKCTEPGCPPVETVIALLPNSMQTGEKRQVKIHKPLSEVTEQDVVQALAGPHVHHHTPKE